MKIEFLWFDDCPNHEKARELLLSVVHNLGIEDPVQDVDASDPATAELVRFPGSPTIRVDDIDVEPDFVDPGEYAPRCRLYATADGLRGIPQRDWIVDALRK